jgi:hypothetical protein
MLAGSTMWVKGLGRVSNPSQFTRAPLPPSLPPHVFAPAIGERAIYSALLLVQL